jgi:sodium-dependent dicarboxylate transporter 2/3/5
MRPSRTIRRYAAIASAVALLILVLALPLPPRESSGVSLSPRAKASLAVVLFALVLWATEALPFHITGFLALSLLALVGVSPFADVVRLGFGSHIFPFMIGVMILSTFVSNTGLGKRVVLIALSRLPTTRTRVVILLFLALGAVLSMWLSNMAVAAILTPLAAGIARDEEAEPRKSNFARALLIACAWGPSIGGVGSPAGAGPNPLTIGFLRDLAATDITFARWMLTGVPSMLVLLFPAWLILCIAYPPERARLARNRDELRAQLESLGPVSRDEKVTVAVVCATATLWLAGPLLSRVLGVPLPISLTALLGGSLFFLPGVSSLQWKRIERGMEWGSMLLVVCGIGLGMSLHSSGAAEWMSSRFVSATLGGLPPMLRPAAIVAGVSVLKVVLSSNSVSASIVVPLMIVAAPSVGADAAILALPAGISASLSFILVTSAPTNVIAYSAGYFSIGDMVKPGVILTLLTSVAVGVVCVLTIGT